MNEQECTDTGGHCFEQTNIIYPTYPPQYPEECKHCGKRRVATRNPEWHYIYPDDK